MVRSAAAADPEIAELWESGQSDRFAGQQLLLQLGPRRDSLPKGMDYDTAVGVLYAVGSPET